MRSNACLHRLDLGLYSHPKELCANGVRTHVNSRGNNALYRKEIPPFMRIGPTPLHQAKQWVNTLLTSYSGPPNWHSNLDGRREAGKAKVSTLTQVAPKDEGASTDTSCPKGRRCQHWHKLPQRTKEPTLTASCPKGRRSQHWHHKLPQTTKSRPKLRLRYVVCLEG